MKSQLKKIIAFSLWGNDPRYLIPAVLNARIAPKVYPGWDVYFYVSDDLDRKLVEELKSLGCIVVRCGQTQGTNGAMWRIQAARVEGVDAIIFRDADSLLSEREANIVNDWLKSSYTLSIMRDHPWHAYPILAGMWGVRGTGILYVKKCIAEWFAKPDGMVYFEDQMWLYEHIYLHYKGDMFIHSPYLKYRGEVLSSVSRVKHVEHGFIGCVYGQEAPCDKSYIPKRRLCIDLPDITTNMVHESNPFSVWRDSQQQHSISFKSKCLFKQLHRKIKKMTGLGL